MHRLFGLGLLVLSSWAIGQNCTTFTVVNAFDRKTWDDIKDLQPQDFEAKVGHAVVPIVSVTPDFNNRVLVLLEIDGTKSERIEDTVNLAIRLARQAPDGRPLAFGIFAKRSLFTKSFNTDSQERAKEIAAVIEDAPTLGQRVALYDALHNALAVFGQHQPGDTVLLISDGFDEASGRGGSEVAKEFEATGTRLLVEMRQPLSHVTGNFMWKPPEQDREILEHMSLRSGGAYTMFNAYLFDFPWRGYMIGVSIPNDSQRTHKWKLRLGSAVTTAHRRTSLNYPESLPGCGSIVAKEKRAPVEGERTFH